MEKVRRSKGVLFTDEEKDFLEEAYQNSSKIASQEAKSIAETMGCEEYRVRNWFSRRRKRDENVPAKPYFTAEQREKLEIAFQQKGTMPDNHVLEEIAKELNVKDVKRVAGWFSRKRIAEHVSSTPISSRKQNEYLMAVYTTTKSPRRRKMNEIAEKFGTTTDQIYAWFLEERNKEKKDGVSHRKKRTTSKCQPGKADLDTTTTELLEAAFVEDPSPTSEKLKEIQEKTDVDEHRLEIWFDRKRRSVRSLVVTEKSKAERQSQNALREAYQKNKYLTAKEISELGDRIGMTQTRARRWFKFYRDQDKDFNKDILLHHKYTIIEANKLSVLNEAYQENKNLTPQEIHALADRVELQRTQVLNWVRWKRSKDKDYQSRFRHNAEQTRSLQAAYQINPSPSKAEKRKLAMDNGLSLRQVSTWLYRCAKNKSDRSSLTATQRDVLLGGYKEDRYPHAEKLTELANCVGLTESQVRNWFQEWAKEEAKKLKAADPPVVKQEESDQQDMKVELKIEPMDDAK